VGAGTKKRKAAKIVNEDHELGLTDGNQGSKETGAKATKKQKKKKAKTVKLTFGDDEEEAG
jgi:hypothetical protein